MNDKVLGALGILGGVAVGVGLAWAAGSGGVTYAGVPVALLCCAGAFAVQWLMFIHAWVRRTEALFDLTGSITYIVMLLAALSLTGLFDVRSLAITGLILIWALRLGPFLYWRTRQAGEDRRFRSIKQSFPIFLMTWTLQGAWVFVTASCAVAAVTSGRVVAPDAWLGVGVLVWLGGFAIEVIADRQKTAFRAQPENANQFIRSGLWAWSRHPNYFGEIVLWLGIALISLPVLQGWQYLTLISPLFVVLLLTRISGVRMLEARGRKQWGDDPEYQAYMRNTPMLVLRPPRGD